MTKINLVDLNKTFSNGNSSFQALKDINLSINQGDFVSIVGKSGSGKTTLMNMLAGIDYPTTGTVQIDDSILNDMSESKLSKWRGTNIGIVFQFFQLIPTLTILENVMLPMDFCKTYPQSQRSKRAIELLKQMGIEDQGNKLPTALSGGQQQRAAIARALANNPSIILADEPTGNLDSSTTKEVFQIFKDLAAQGKTIILVTHDHEIADNCSSKIHISDGQILSFNRKEETL